ncbi:MAG: hybrid sensor histidine kinase/response regulator [Pelomonas sp.]|nr:hybrid sensor histidine kinase/response regulator [Roseateles sp.]
MAHNLAVLALSAACIALLIAGWALKVRVQRRHAAELAALDARIVAAEEKSASRLQLLAAACHDLRQPAHALGLIVELGRDLQPAPSHLETWMGQVRDCTRSLTEMLDELMDVSRLDGGVYTPLQAPLSIAELLQDIESNFTDAAEAKGLELEIQPADLHVLSDRHLLRRIVFNLVSNAVKYSEFGCVAINATVRGEEVVLTVDDNGPGIPKAKLEDVFTEYVRLDPGHRAAGLGIGLATVRRAAAVLSHPVKIVSNPGFGTSISIRLPRHQPAGPAGAPDRPAADLAGCAVGLIEDDAAVRHAMHELLTRWGFRAFSAAQAVALLRELEKEQVQLDLVVADYHLSDTDGLSAIATVRQAMHDPALPALLITGDPHEALASEAGRAVVRLAAKPVAPARLEALVRQFARHRGQDPVLPGASGASPRPPGEPGRAH